MSVTQTAVIADSASLSNAVALNAAKAVAVFVPAGVEGSVLTFQGSHNGATFGNVYSDVGGTSTELSVAFTAGAMNALPDLFRGFSHIKVRTGTAASPSVQTGAASLTVIAN